MARSADHFVLFADVIASRQIDPKALAAGLKALLNHLRQRRRACFVLPPMRSRASNDAGFAGRGAARHA